MRFRSKRMQEQEFMAFEDEMIRFTTNLLYNTTLDVDAIKDRFAEQFGEENLYIVDELMDEQ